MSGRPAAADGGERLTIYMVGPQWSIHVRRWSDALAARGHRVIPVDLSGRGRSVPAKLLVLASARLRLARVAGARRSVVAVHFVPGGIAALALRGVHPVVPSIWGSDVTLQRPGLRGRWSDALRRRLLRSSDAVTATSHFLAATARRRYGVETAIVPFGIDLEQFRPAAGPRDPGPVRFVFVKWLNPVYGPDILLDALARLPADLAWEATLAGDGPLQGALVAQAERLGIAGRVHFLGAVAHEAVPDVLRSADIFVMPSRRESWGVAAVEAAACGLPVVATSTGGVPEVVEDGKTGLLVPPDDAAALAKAMETLARDADLRHRLGTAGRARAAERFEWSTCVDLMEALYRSVAR